MESPGRPLDILRRWTGGLLLLALAASATWMDAAADTTTPLAIRLPYKLAASGAAWDGTYAYVLGGDHYDGTQSDQVLRFDPATQSTSVRGVRFPTPRAGAAVAWDGGHAYAFGGSYSITGTGGATNQYPYLDEIVRYDPEADELRVLATRLPGVRTGSSAAWSGQYVFVFGGQNSQSYLDEIVRFDPSTGDVRTMNGRIPAGVYSPSAVWIGQHAYLFGGGGANGWSRDILRYDPTLDLVTVMQPKLPDGRQGIAAVAAGSSAYLFGGNLPDDVLRYDAMVDDLAVLPARLGDLHGFSSAVWTGTKAYVFGGDGCSGACDQIVEYDPGQRPLQASFSYVVDNLILHVDGRASSPPDYRVTADVYRWTWGDGSSSGGQTNILLSDHQYASAGRYEVTLAMTDHHGRTVTSTQGVYLGGSGATTVPPSTTPGATPTTIPPPSNLGPVARFEAKATYLSVAVDAGASYDPDGRVVAYRWTWGDGTPQSEGTTARHTYATPGTYGIGLVVEDDRAAVGYASQSISVQPINVAPAARFTCALDPGGRLRVDAGPSQDPDGSIAYYRWDFGDGNGSAQLVAEHQYAEPGVYKVKLTVVDDRGTATSLQKEFAVHFDGEAEACPEATATAEPTPPTSDAPPTRTRAPGLPAPALVGVLASLGAAILALARRVR